MRHFVPALGFLTLVFGALRGGHSALLVPGHMDDLTGTNAKLSGTV